MIPPDSSCCDLRHATSAALPAPSGLGRAEVEAAKVYAAASRASGTRCAYAADWRGVLAWCGEHGTTPLPADPYAAASD